MAHPYPKLLSWVNLLLLISAILLAAVPLTTGIALESTSYLVKEASLFGLDYKYAMFEAQFDEEVYLVDQWACQCVNASLPCVASPSQTNPPGINETVVDSHGIPYVMPTVKAGEWYNGSFYNADYQYLKFNVPYDASIPCPMVTLELKVAFGEITLFAASSFVPTQLDYEWSRVLISPSTIQICPSHPFFVYGNYYVLISGGRKFTNIYSFRYTLQQSPQCANIVANYTQVEADLNYASTVTPPTWLTDGVAETVTWPFNASNPAQNQAFYALYAPTTCASFSVALYPTIYFDTWLLLSLDGVNPNPSYFVSPGSAKYLSLLSGMNRLNVHLCNPDSSKNYVVLFIGLFPTVQYATPNQVYQLIATSQSYAAPKALSTMSFTESTFNLAYGAIPALSCDNGYYQCWFPGGTECPTEHMPCCYPFWGVPPEVNTQAMWPWNSEDTSVASFHLPINFTDRPAFVPGKLAFTLFLEYSKGGERTIMAPEANNCTLVLGDTLVDATGTILPTRTITFTPSSLTCDYAKYQAVANKLTALKENYLQASSVPELALNQLQMAMTSWNNDYLACSSYIQQELTSVVPNYTTSPAYVCPYLPGTPEFLNSACCVPTLLPYASCHPTMVNEPLPITGSYLASATSQQCNNPECSQSSIQTWVQQQNYVASPQTGCTANFYAQASPERLIDLMKFATDCKVHVEGPQLLGAPCQTSADCFNNVACLPLTKTCNNTYQDVVQCLAESIDRDIAISLFNSWAIPTDPDVPSLIAAFTERWVFPLCVGPKCQDYRDSNKFFLVNSACVDTCLVSGFETYCPDLVFETTAVCPSDGSCQTAVDANACYRNWKIVKNDTKACTEVLTCNWRQENYWPCLPDDDLTNCAPLCVNSSLNPNVCLDCSQNILGSCLEVTDITDGARCGQGLCSAGIQITDETICARSGNCSFSCPTCDTQPGCESAGQCSDLDEFGAALAELNVIYGAPSTGVCLISPGIWTGISYSCAYYPSTLPFTTLTSLGCASPVLDEPTCLYIASLVPAYLGIVSWYTPAANASQCNATWGCYDPTIPAFFTQRTQEECSYCSFCQWKPAYTYANGTWTPGRMQLLDWQPRSYSRMNSVALAVDYNTIVTDVNVAISNAFAHAYYTEALCRYENVDDLTSSIVCDCNSNATQCFASAEAAPIGSFRVCPYQTVTVGTLDASVTVRNDSVPIDAPCQTVTLATLSVGKYQVPPDFSVTNQLFKQIQSNPYWIVENSHQAVTGQLISNAITLTVPYSPMSMLTLCIQTETFIEVESVATLLTLAQLQPDNAIQIYDKSHSFTATSADLTNGSRLSICGQVNSSGTWFAVAVVPDYLGINPKPSGQTITAFVFYVIVIALAMIQFVVLLIDREYVKLFAFKVVALFIIMVNGAARCVYILPPNNAFVGANIESIAFIIYELPTFLYFSVFTVIVYLWTMVINNTRRFGRNHKFTAGSSRVLLVSFILANVFMYFVFVVFIYLTAILPTKTASSPCYLGNLDSTSSTVEHSIKVAYWIFQCIISIILCLGFLITATLLLKMIHNIKTGTLGKENGAVHSGGNEDVVTFQLLIISVVAFVCIVFLLVRSIIFLVVAINNSTIQIMTFCMLEIIPQLMLLLYIRPPRIFMTAVAQATSGVTGRSLGGHATHTRTSTSKGGSTRSRSANSSSSQITV